MRRTIENSRTKLTIFFVTSLFAMMLLMQSTANGQITPTIRPTRPPTSIDIRSFKPDLHIGDIKYDAKNCSVNIRVANSGTGAGIFNVWVELVGYYKYAQVQSVAALESNGDLWLNYSLVPEAPAKNSQEAQMAKMDAYLDGLTGKNSRPVCRIDSLLKVRAVVDPRYVDIREPRANINGIYQALSSRSLLPVGSAPPKKQTEKETVAVVEPQVAESNENNNEAIVNKGDMKLYP